MNLSEKLNKLREWCLENSDNEIDWLFNLYYHPDHEKSIPKWRISIDKSYSTDRIVEGFHHTDTNIEGVVDKTIQTCEEKQSTKNDA